jgi:hypothetical protein
MSHCNTKLLKANAAVHASATWWQKSQNIISKTCDFANATL